jgi:dual specificity phosphatase 3
MPDISFVTDRVATGGDLPLHLGRDVMRDHLAELRSAGVTHVIDNRLEWSDEQFVAVHCPDMTYLHNGQDDIGQRMPDCWFDRGVDFALDALARPGTVVLSHCHMGINRGPSMTYALLLALGHDPVEALATIRSARPIAAIAYAQDALSWWHRRAGAAPACRSAERAAVDAWFGANPLDVMRIIREIRTTERLTA